MRTVRPCYIEFTKRWFLPTWDAFGFWEFVILVMSSLCTYQCKIVVLPEFTPNDKMLQLHADKGEEDWEIFAECVRDVMSKKSGLPKNDLMLREKLLYYKMCIGEVKTIQIDGKTYSFGKKNKNPQEGLMEKDIQEPLIQS